MPKLFCQCVSLITAPQRLKPLPLLPLIGTAEAVPFPKTTFRETSLPFLREVQGPVLQDNEGNAILAVLVAGA